MTRYLVKHQARIYPYISKRRYLVMRLCYQFAELFSKIPSAWSDTFSEKRSYQGKKVKLYSLLSLCFPYTLTKNIIFTTI